MINEKQKQFLEKKYQLNLFGDILFTSDRQVTFLIDKNESPLLCYIISGDVTKLALPKFDIIEVKKLLDYVEPDNLLAEVEGKHVFIDTIKEKFNAINDELFLYLPIKRTNNPLWLYTGFRRIRDGRFVVGQVLRVFEDTPKDIIHYQKTHQDSLTRLFTRDTFKLHMEYLDNYENSYIMYIDIDGFKRINDKYGHQRGDKFLVDISNHFISNWEYNVLYYRLGGDEFAVYCYDHNDEEVKKRAKQIIYDIENLNDLAKELKISVSIGITKITSEIKDYHTLLNTSDDAMYQSKARGIGKYTFYNK